MTGEHVTGACADAIVHQDRNGLSVAEIAENLAVDPVVVTDTIARVTATRTRHRVMSRADLDRLPDLEPLLDNTLDQGNLHFLYGNWGVGKSFVALDWSASVATGRPWVGRKVTKPGRVLYVCAEGAYGFRGRIAAWESQNDVRLDGLLTIPQPVNLRSAAECADLGELAAIDDVVLVVVDTLSRCIPGADENAAQDASAIVRNLQLLQGENRAVLVVAHTGKDAETFRGSSAYEGAADTVYLASRTGDRQLQLKRTKRKDGPEQDVIHLGLEVMPDASAPIVVADKPADRTGSAQTILSAVMSAGMDGPIGQPQLRDMAKLSNGSFDRGLKELVNRSDLILTTDNGRKYFQLNT